MKLVKKIVIALLALVFVLAVVSSIAFWYIFTPEKLTSLVNSQAKEYLTCNTLIEKIEPTFLGSYPFFGIELTNVCLTERNNSSKADTLLYSQKCYISLNLMSYLLDDNIKLNSFFLKDGYLNYKIDAFGHSNFDIFKSSSDSTETDSEATTFGDIDISNVEFENFNANYVDELALRKATLTHLNSELEFKYNKDKQFVELDMQLNKLLFSTSDSLALFVVAKDCDLKFTAKATDKNLFHSEMNLVCNKLSFSMAGNKLLSNMKIDTYLPFNLNLAENNYTFQDSKLRINDEQEILFSGNVQLQKDSTISTNIAYSTNEFDLEKTLALVPKAYSAPLKDLIAKGSVELSGSIVGVMSDKSTPVVSTRINLQQGEINYASYPKITDIQLALSARVDMNKTQSSKLLINSSTATLRNSTVVANGTISNLLDTPQYDIYLKGDYNLADFKSFIPKGQNIILKGLLKGDLHTRFSQSNLDKEEYHRIFLAGDFNAKNFYAVYNDTTTINLPSAKIKLNLPSQTKADKNLLFAKIKIDAPKCELKMSPTMSAVTEDLDLSINVNNPLIGKLAPITSGVFQISALSAVSDTLSIKANNASGQFKYLPSYKGKQEIASIYSTLKSKGIAVLSPKSTLFDAKNLYAKTNFIYDDSKKNVILKWQPELDVNFTDANYNLSSQLNGKISTISFSLDPERMDVKSAKMTLGNSDFSLTGELTDITNYLNDKALLKGRFNLTSKNTDVYQLMDIFNGLGSQDSTVTNKTPSADDPFMVPKGIEVRLNTSIAKTVINKNIIENIRGGLTVKDGTLVLDQMGFTSKAANMQLTAMYRSDRKNHLFTGVDFHLLDIDIAELIALIPSVDTMIPMLKSFKGKGEFHLAAETYLKSDYSLKQSTVRGAAAFQGQELTIMDTETFDMIANKLLFKKKTVNKIDSLSVEMTLFKDEIDVYPFLIVMDNYKAVISGRHNMDNSFDYHISVTDTPLPVRLGLNVTGTMDNLKYELVDCKYKYLYNPKKQGALEAQTLRLKKLISESLKQNVKEIK